MNSRITDVDSRSADFSLRRDTFGRTLLGIPLKGKEVWERWMIKKKKTPQSVRTISFDIQEVNQRYQKAITDLLINKEIMIKLKFKKKVCRRRKQGRAS